MTLLEGQILRFKGRNARTHLEEVAAELHGCCKREGNQLLITKNTRLHRDPVETPGVELLGLQPGVLGTTGNGSASETPIRRNADMPARSWEDRGQ